MRLRELGFMMEENWLRMPRYGILGEGAVVFVARKP